MTSRFQSGYLWREVADPEYVIRRLNMSPLLASDFGNLGRSGSPGGRIAFIIGFVGLVGRFPFSKDTRRVDVPGHWWRSVADSAQ